MREEMVRVMRQEMRRDEIARPLGRAAEIQERAALAEWLLREDMREDMREERDDDVLARAAFARCKQAELLAEWERNVAGGAPCMRIAPWKGNVQDGD
jgi:hypothetical protein